MINSTLRQNGLTLMEFHYFCPKRKNIFFFKIQVTQLSETDFLEISLIQGRKEQILNAAARLFRKKGFAATTVRMIASEMKMEAASLYNHISSKQEILKELLFLVAGKFTLGMDEINSGPFSPLEKLEKLVLLHIRLALEQPDAVALILGEWIHLEEPDLQDFIRLRTDYESRFKRIIDEGLLAGQLKALDPDIAVFSILSTLHALPNWLTRHRMFDPEKLKSELVNSLLYGLRKT
jgi:AcrR family transcriptional regulator